MTIKLDFMYDNRGDYVCNAALPDYIITILIAGTPASTHLFDLICVFSSLKTSL